MKSAELRLVFFAFVPHHKAILFVHFDCSLVKSGVFVFQAGQKVDREAFPTLAGHFPNLVKVGSVAEILSHSNRQVKVQHSMPPESGHEDGLPWVLDALNNRMQSVTA